MNIQIPTDHLSSPSRLTVFGTLLLCCTTVRSSSQAERHQSSTFDLFTYLLDPSSGLDLARASSPLAGDPEPIPLEPHRPPPPQLLLPRPQLRVCHHLYASVLHRPHPCSLRHACVPAPLVLPAAFCSGGTPPFPSYRCHCLLPCSSPCCLKSWNKAGGGVRRRRKNGLYGATCITFTVLLSSLTQQ